MTVEALKPILSAQLAETAGGYVLMTSHTELIEAFLSALEPLGYRRVEMYGHIDERGKYVRYEGQGVVVREPERVQLYREVKT